MPIYSGTVEVVGFVAPMTVYTERSIIVGS